MNASTARALLVAASAIVLPGVGSGEGTEPPAPSGQLHAEFRFDTVDVEMKFDALALPEEFQALVRNGTGWRVRDRLSNIKEMFTFPEGTRCHIEDAAAGGDVFDQEPGLAEDGSVIPVPLEGRFVEVEYEYHCDGAGPRYPLDGITVEAFAMMPALAHVDAVLEGEERVEKRLHPGEPTLRIAPVGITPVRR